MRDVVENILELQPEWTASNSEPMELRGYLVRGDGPEWLRSQIPALVASIPGAPDDLAAEGRDGTGLKTEIPWFRLYSASRSPRARFGFYVVYLFDGPGDAVYLSLNQGTTRWNGADFLPLEESLLNTRVGWARGVLLEAGFDPTTYLASIDLRAEHTNLGHQYELGNVAAIRYQRGGVPESAQLAADVASMTAMLSVLYSAQDSSDTPGERPAEVVLVEESADLAAGTEKPKPTGLFRPSTEQRRAIEERAMEVVRLSLTEIATEVTDTHAGNPFDYRAKIDGEEIFIEVKGTTSLGEQVVLTYNEVAHMKAEYPNTALAIVSEVKLSGSRDAPTAAGGQLRWQMPWKIEDPALTPIAYRYEVGPTYS